MKLVDLDEMMTEPQDINALKLKYNAAGPLIEETLKKIVDQTMDVVNNSLSVNVEAGVDFTFISHAKIESMAGSISKEALRIYNKHSARVITQVLDKWKNAGYNVKNEGGVITIKLFGEE